MEHKEVEQNKANQQNIANSQVQYPLQVMKKGVTQATPTMTTI
jgi:hypothetical protein